MERRGGMGSGRTNFGHLNGHDRIWHDGRRNVWHATLDPDGRFPLVEELVVVLSVILGESVDALPPLEGVVDTEALAALLESAVDTDVRVEFEYDGCAVSMTGAGNVTVHRRD